MEKIFSMVGGDGEFSYEKMGVIQAYTIRKLEPLLGEAIKHLNLPEHGPLHIADFGCSTGKNSITCINFIVKSIAERYAKAAGETSGHDTTCMPEMLVFFIDLPVNDFNHLIQLLASKAKNGGDSIGVDGADVEKVNNYFSAAVGGSFYNRLLPKESMHFAISTWALHWMSQIPKRVTDPNSPCYNKGRSWILGGDPLIAQEFAQQSQLDLDNFFNCRAAEMAPGGIVFVLLGSRQDATNPTNQCDPDFGPGPDYENAWNDLVVDGVITTHTRDTFNVPLYYRSKEEVETSIIKCGAFDIQYVQSWDDESICPKDELMHMLQSPQSFAKFYSAWVRSMVGPIMEAHMGLQATNEFFIRHQRRIAARATSVLSDPKAQEEYKCFNLSALVVVLKRKIHTS